MHPPQPHQPPADVGPHGRTQQRDRPTVLAPPTSREQHGATLELLRAGRHAELTTERGDPILAGADPMGADVDMVRAHALGAHLATHTVGRLEHDHTALRTLEGPCRAQATEASPDNDNVRVDLAQLCPLSLAVLSPVRDAGPSQISTSWDSEAPRCRSALDCPV